MGCRVLVFVFALTLAAPAADPRADDFVHVRKGTLPVVISAPHGGRKKVPDVAERKGDGIKQFVTVRGDNTAEIAEALAAEIEAKLGGKPWVVVARFERKYIDANRPRESAYESDTAKPYYDAYHVPLEAACKAVKEKHGRGLLLDIHGQAPFPDTICRGTQNGKSVTLLKDRFGWAAVTGKNSVLGKLEASGYKILPKGDAPPDAKEDARFNGGYTVGTYGSHAGYGIDAIQLELGGDLRKKAALPKTAKDIAAAVAAFHDEYLK
jgi:N-formylglutamate amidohydrolase